MSAIPVGGEPHRPVGAARDVRVEARLLASTNRDLRAESAAGQFRQDLFYRLAQHEVQVPALDERRDDFRAIASSLVPSLEFSEDAWRWLERRSYPGNVRELSTILLRMKSHCDAEKRSRVDHDVLRELEDHTPPVDKAMSLAEHALRLGATLAEVRRAQRFYAELGRAKADGNVSRAARELGVSRGGLRSTLATKRTSAARAVAQRRRLIGPSCEVASFTREGCVLHVGRMAGATKERPLCAHFAMAPTSTSPRVGEGLELPLPSPRPRRLGGSRLLSTCAARGCVTAYALPDPSVRRFSVRRNHRRGPPQAKAAPRKA